MSRTISNLTATLSEGERTNLPILAALSCVLERLGDMPDTKANRAKLVRELGDLIGASDKFVPGDVVELKSGGPWMTVKRVTDGSATCTWFDEEGKHAWEERFDVLTIKEAA